MAHVFFGDRMEKENIERCCESVTKHLHERDALVVFDSFEVVDKDTALLRWLGDIRVPARVLVTTREVPQVSFVSTQEVPELTREKAVELFIERAKLRGLKSVDKKVVSDLCVEIGGLPLAIELLAVHATGQPLSLLLEQVREGLAVLDAEDPNRSERQRSILACFRFSYERLSAPASDLFLRLSVLPDGAGAEIIAAVMGTRGWGAAAEELQAKSVWRFDGQRYTVHPLVRQFALEQAGDERANFKQHAARSVIHLAKAKGELTKPGSASDEMR